MRTIASKEGDSGIHIAPFTEAGPGDILVVGPDTPHKFKNIGKDRLDIICIHASPRMIQEDLEEG